MDLRIQCPALTPTDAPGLTNHCPPMRPKGDQARVLQRDFTNGSQKNSTLGQQTVLFWAAGRKTSLWQEMRPVKEKQKQGGLLMKRIILDIMELIDSPPLPLRSSSYMGQEIPIPFLCKPPPPILRHQKRIGTSKRKASSLSNTTLNKNFLSKAPLEILSAVSHTRTVVHSSII